MIEYIALGTGALALYGAYCNYSFYRELKNTLVETQAKTKNRTKTLEDVFTDDGIELRTKRQPKSGIPPNGDMGTFFLKPMIHLAKTRLLQGAYDSKN
jgi:hypothetical protein